MNRNRQAHIDQQFACQMRQAHSASGSPPAQAHRAGHQARLLRCDLHLPVAIHNK
jgi:hypothetical protein